MAVLVTGAAGFIGSFVSTALLQAGETVVGVDDLNSYYDVSLKEHRLALLNQYREFSFIHKGVAELKLGDMREAPSSIVHLAAQAGVRYSLTNPGAYVQSNLVGFASILEIARQSRTEHLLYASSSSVYGSNSKVPFSVTDPVNHPVSLYAASKRSNELMAEAYSALFDLPCTGLRFFTVYGPRGRPDMAVFDFARRMLAGEPIELFGGGELSRDFTYIDDITKGVLLALRRPPKSTSQSGDGINETGAPHRVFNIGRGKPLRVVEMVDALEESLGVKAQRVFVDRQPGDVDFTWADTKDFNEWCGFVPTTNLKDGVARFADWYLEHYRASQSGPADERSGTASRSSTPLM